MANQVYGRYNAEGGTRWRDPANIVLSVWLFLSPWILQFGGSASTASLSAGAAWNAWVMGVLVFIFALSALGRLALWQEWINMVFGAWIFVAPWALGFAFGSLPAAAWDHWIIGALIFLVSASGLGNVRKPARGVDTMHHQPQHR